MTPQPFAFAAEAATTALAVIGIGYFLAIEAAILLFVIERGRPLADFHPSVSVLKSLKGVDAGMMDAFRSHCRQDYAGDYELLFGVSSTDEPAVEVVRALQLEFPERAIRLIECPAALGTNGKVSTLAQLVPAARNEFLLINDSDIFVSPRYLQRVMAKFADGRVGLSTALYRGHAHGTMASHFEALGIATDFMPSVLLSRVLERGMRYGLGSTLAVRREALEAIGGIGTLADQLADDYELGARIAKARWQVALSPEVVATAVPPYDWEQYFDHQIRWLRTVRDARPWGYVGLVCTHGFTWACLNVVASGASPLSLWLLGLSFFLRLGTAMSAGAVALGDHEVLPRLWMLPLRDLCAMALWVAAFAGNTVVWRGQRFVLNHGKLEKTI